MVGSGDKFSFAESFSFSFKLLTFNKLSLSFSSSTFCAYLPYHNSIGGISIRIESPVLI